jgi:hypothetical protein
VICTAPWRLSKVIALANFRLEVTFIDGTQGFVDLTQRIFSPKAGVFSVLQDTTLFNQVYIQQGAVTWPGDIDLAPDAMYNEIKRHGVWILK